jgi:hypothetical protein
MQADPPGSAFWTVGKPNAQGASSFRWPQYLRQVKVIVHLLQIADQAEGRVWRTVRIAKENHHVILIIMLIENPNMPIHPLLPVNGSWEAERVLFVIRTGR